MNKVNCLAPYGHYHLDVHGYAKTCCWWQGSYNKKISDFDSLEEMGKYHAGLMTDDNLVDLGCAKCVLYEQKGSTSLREMIHRTVKEEDLLHLPKELEVSLDSICNFACVICDNSRSSKWRSLSKKVDWTPKINSEDPNHFKTVMRLLKNSDLSQLDSIRMLGGEPFYTKHFEEFVDLLKEKCDISKVRLRIVSNCSVFPKDRLYNILKQFRRIDIMASMDAVGNTAETVRYGTNWPQVEENLVRWIKEAKQTNFEKVRIAFTPTFSIYNLEHVEDLKSWYVRKTGFTCPIAFTLAREPWLTIENLNQDFRKQFDKNIFNHRKFDVQSDFFQKWPTKEKIDYDLIYRYIETYSNMTGIDVASTIPQVMEQLKRQQDV